MSDGKKSARRQFVEALTGIWEDKRKAHLPDPNTRDERYVAGAIRLARSEDVRLILESIPYEEWPPDTEPQELPATAKAWLDVRDGQREYERWVTDLLPDVVARAVDRLKHQKSEKRADIRRRRKNVYRNGRRTKARRPGPLPNLSLNVRIGLRKLARK